MISSYNNHNNKIMP